jgi:hypothetical protein
MNDQKRPGRFSGAAVLLAVVIVLAAALLFLRIVRGVEAVQCMTLKENEARVDCLRQMAAERPFW